MNMTVSMSVGRLAIAHDIREEISANVDPELSKNNETFIDELEEYDHDLVNYTNATFQPFINEYNLNQTRENRKKTGTYVEMVEKENAKLLAKAKDNKEKGIKTSTRATTKLAHEYVLQIGNRDTNGISSGADIEANKKYCKAVLDSIQKKYPHVKILLATFHADEPEGTPHMHILVQFVGENYKQGLSHQISISKALELDGFERSQNRGDYSINRWTSDIQDNIMTPVMKEMFKNEREVIGDHRKHEDTPFFRQKAIEEAAAIQKQKDEFALDVQNILNSTKDKIDALTTEKEDINDKIVEEVLNLLVDDQQSNSKEKNNVKEYYKALGTDKVKEREYGNGKKFYHIPAHIAKNVKKFIENVEAIFNKIITIDEQIEQSKVSAIKDLDKKAEAIVISMQEIENEQVVESNTSHKLKKEEHTH